MDALRCLICNHNTAPVHAVDVSELAAQYYRQLQVDVREEFSEIAHLDLNRCPICDFTFFSPRLAGSQKFYESLQGNLWYYLEDKPEFSTAKRFTRPTDRLLDIGCGSGAFAQDHPASNYIGLEYTASAVKKARARNLTVIQQSIEEHAVSNPSAYDVVCAFQVLEHVCDQRLFIQACIDVCRTGGKIIFSTPNADSFISMVKNCVLNLPPHHTAWFSKKLWMSLPHYFPLRMIEVIDEPLEPVHHQLYVNTLIARALERVLGIRSFKPIDCTLRNRVINKFSRIYGRLVAHGLADKRMQPKGQSITAVYEKL